MKNIKLISCLLIILLLVFFVVLICSFFFWQNYTLIQIKALTGAFESGEASSAMGAFRRYIEATPQENADFISMGEQAFTAAGYSYSAGKVLSNSFQNACAACLLISLFLCFLLIFFVFLLFNKSRNYINEIKGDLKDANIHIAVLKAKNEKELMQMHEYEENLYHQIKTPLTGLRLAVDQLYAKCNAHNSQAYETAQMQLRKLSRMTTLFLQDRRISSNIVRFNFAVQSLDSILYEAVTQLSDYADFKNVSLIVQAADGEYFLPGDQVWLQETIITLIENAIDHAGTNEGVHISLSPCSPYFRLQICTSGAQLIPEQEKQIFERFFTNKTSHFGIGLHMAKSVIEAHHGEITAYNKNDPSPCVCFDVFFPVLSGPDAYVVT